jgi:hypothetical protein
VAQAGRNNAESLKNQIRPVTVQSRSMFEPIVIALYHLCLFKVYG